MINWIKKQWLLLVTGAFTLAGIFAILTIVKPEWFAPLAATFTGSGVTIATIGLALSTSWLVYVTFLTLKENQKQREENEQIRNEERKIEISLRIRKWAEDSIEILITWSPAFKLLKIRHLSALSDANKLGNVELLELVKKVVNKYLELRKSMEKPNITLESVKPIIDDLIDNLSQIIDVTG